MATINITLNTTSGQDSGLQYQLASRISVGATGGTGYTVGDVLTVVSGTGTASTFTVTAVDGAGQVTGIKLRTRGDYTVQPTSPMDVTGGTGTGCKLKMKYSDVTAMLTDFINKAIPDYRKQWKDAQRDIIATALDSASNTQTNNVAAELGVVLP